MKMDKICVFVVWLCIAPIVVAIAFNGWQGAINPPTYMRDQYAWRIAGATMLGILFPLVAIGTLVAQIKWWFRP